MSHANAKLNEYGRMLLVERILDGWSQAEAAEAQGISRSTVAKWWKRYREEGLSGLRDRSSKAKRLPHALGEQVIEAICRLRRELGAGPHRIGYELGLAASTVCAVLRRAGLAVLSRLDRTTRSVIRYERDHPGALVHLDVKRLGRIPDGGGKRFDADFNESRGGRKRPGAGKRGHDYIHVAVDDHSRFVYAEALPDEKAGTTAGFLERMVFALAQRGVSVERVLTDNARCYYSGVFLEVASHYGIQQRRRARSVPRRTARPKRSSRRSNENGAYRRPYQSNAQRLEALDTFLVDYNFARPHTAIGNQPPASRL